MPDILLYTVTLGFLCGVITPSNILLGPIIGLVLFLGIIYFGFSDKLILKKILILGFIFLSVFGLGIIRYKLDVVTPPLWLESSIDQEIQIEGVIADDPNVRDGKTVAIIRVGKIGIRATIKTDVPISYNDAVVVSGIISHPRNFMTTQGTEFDYVSYLNKDDIFYVIPNAKIISHIVDDKFSLTRTLFEIRHSVQEKLTISLPRIESGFIGGILLGSKNDIDPALQEALVTTGTVHLTSLSGYNVSVVADSISQTLRLFLPQLLASFIGGVGIILFVIMTGASSTAVRAGLMAILLIVARISGRPASAVRVLAFAAIVLVIISPTYLVLDTSFQLSFLATLGLLLISPVYVKWLSRYLPKWLAELIGATLAAETVVVPLIIYKMGIFSLISLPVNIIVLPFIPLLMFLGFMLICLGFLGSFLGILFGYPIYLFSHAIIIFIEKASTIPMASITVSNVPLSIISIYYLLIMFIVVRVNLTKTKK